MKEANKFTVFFQRVKEFILPRKGYCLGAVILVVFLAVFLANADIETVSQHNAKQTSDKAERQSILAELEKQETSRYPETSEMKESEITQEQTSFEETDSVTDFGRESENQQQTSELHSSGAAGGNETVELKNPVSESRTSVKAQQDMEKSSEHLSEGGQNAGTQTTPVTSGTDGEEKEQEKTTKEPVNEYIAVTIKISCEKVLNHPDLKTAAAIPADGIFLNTKIAVKKGQTVFDALAAACADNGISYVNNGSAHSAYISSIGGLAEKECGRYSGWKYQVNNVVPGVACSSYELNEQDEILWYYAPDFMD